ncbi:MAG: response regulator [Spirochaetaceae bacterium]|jgi:PleD family two-component response regulator|nr:response regulator [Spirochaetaceae bacterium]
MTERLKNARKSILVVDDSVEILTLINEILGDAYNVYLAKNVKTATNILAVNKIDLILLDLFLGDISGLDYLAVLKKKDTLKDIPVLMISSNSQLMNVSKSTRLGAKGYIVKPVNAVSLRDKIYTLFLDNIQHNAPGVPNAG